MKANLIVKRCYAFNRINKQLIFHILLIGIATVPYALFLATKGMPISEGWYTEFAWQMNHGKVPYRDFALLFPPVYPMIVSVITGLFGYDIIVLRLFGVAVFFLEAVLIYRILSRLFSSNLAAMASIPAVYYIHYGVVDMIMYDVTYVLNLFVFASILFVERAIDTCIDSDDKRAILVNSMLSGVCAGCAAMTKQSTGLAIVAVLLCVFLGGTFLLKLREMKKGLAGYSLGVVAVIVIIAAHLMMSGALGDFLDNCFVGAVGAKGGVGTELFGWIGRSAKQLIFALPLAFFLSAFSLQGMANYKHETKRVYMSIAVVSLCGFAIFGSIFCYRHQGFSQSLSSAYNADMLTVIVFITTSIVFIYSIVQSVLFFRKTGLAVFPNEKGLDLYKLLVISGSVFASGWACGMSGGLANSQVALGMGLLICMSSASLSAIGGGWRAMPTASMVVVASAIVLFVVASRFNRLYYWWGLDEGSIWNQTTYAEVPMLRNIKMSERDAVAYEGAFESARKYLAEDDSVFVFPHCPIMYGIVGKHAESYSIVQWFDVSDGPTLRSDMKRLEDNPPKMIIECEIPEDVMASHESLFGTHQTREMQNSLNEMIASKYVIAEQYEMGNGYVLSICVRNDEWR